MRFLGNLVKLQSLALYGCRGIDDSDSINLLHSELPSLKCLRLNHEDDEDDAMMEDEIDSDEDEDILEEYQDVADGDNRQFSVAQGHNNRGDDDDNSSSSSSSVSHNSRREENLPDDEDTDAIMHEETEENNNDTNNFDDNINDQSSDDDSEEFHRAEGYLSDDTSNADGASFH